MNPIFRFAANAVVWSTWETGPPGNIQFQEIPHKHFLKTMKSKIARLIATWFGCGYFPKGPGTVGSLAAVLMVWYGVPALWGALVLLIPAIWASGVVARELGHDPQVVVVDEVVGQWIALSVAPVEPVPVLAAFVLFRLFDITKPGLVRQFERLEGGWGIMMDDVAAGVLAALVLGFVLRFAGWFNF